jgi:hypothetical protein
MKTNAMSRLYAFAMSTVACHVATVGVAVMMTSSGELARTEHTAVAAAGYFTNLSQWQAPAVQVSASGKHLPQTGAASCAPTGNLSARVSGSAPPFPGGPSTAPPTARWQSRTLDCPSAACHRCRLPAPGTARHHLGNPCSASSSSAAVRSAAPSRTS